ncbi:hypothetical protein GmHk_12G035112 [Glycine max]|nr:hypothetical protein GmHk_12G035112 [Glycine max]
MARSVSASCPYSRDLYGRELTRLLVIIPKVVISLLMASRVEWRRKRERRRHFKEKMSLEEAHHHRRPWIRAWRKKEKMSLEEAQKKL